MSDELAAWFIRNGIEKHRGFGVFLLIYIDSVAWGVTILHWVFK